MKIADSKAFRDQWRMKLRRSGHEIIIPISRMGNGRMYFNPPVTLPGASGELSLLTLKSWIATLDEPREVRWRVTWKASRKRRASVVIFIKELLT